MAENHTAFWRRSSQGLALCAAMAACSGAIAAEPGTNSGWRPYTHFLSTNEIPGQLSPLAAAQPAATVPAATTTTPPAPTTQPAAVPIEKPAPTTSTLDAYVRNKQSQSDRKAAEAAGAMQAQARVSQASSADDSQHLVARLARDEAGAEAAETEDRAAVETAAADREHSVPTVLGDALQKGVEAGITALGTAAGGALGDKAADKVFSKHPTAEQRERPAKPRPELPRAGKRTEPSPTGGTNNTASAEHHGGKRFLCASCGFALVTGEGDALPSHCPACCAGPESAVCNRCGQTWCGLQGSPPEQCPTCGAVNGRLPTDPTSGNPQP